ncbi:hypothetical protein A2U01_0119465, partial [Trifolium medium]|nr:hypothetical protein [Trifolium medium]
GRWRGIGERCQEIAREISPVSVGSQKSMDDYGCGSVRFVWVRTYFQSISDEGDSVS